ncbi:MAG: DUF2085 domain-containing protein [Vicinamibacterales bacterium]
MRTAAAAGAALAGLLWAAALVASPLAVSSARAGAAGRSGASLVYVVGAAVCHQQAARSFRTAGVAWPVCARCTGLYLGGAAGLMLGWLGGAGWRRRGASLATRRALVVVGAPTLVTVATGVAGVWDPANLVRAGLALPLGLLVGLVVSAVVARDLR